MKDYDENKELSYIQYWDVNNWYGWVMSQMLPVNNFDWIKDTYQFNEDFIKTKDEGYFWEIDVQYLQKLHKLHNDLPFLSERIKIEKIEKVIANLHNKTEYVVRIRNFNETLNHRLVLKNVHRVIKSKQNAWLKPYDQMNTGLRKNAKNDFEKDFFQLMTNPGFGKTMGNVRKHRDIKLVSTERRRNYLVSKPNYHATKFFTENLLAIKIKKQK